MSAEIPDLIRALEGRIEDWKDFSGIVSITLQSSNLDQLYFFKKSMQLAFDKQSIFIGTVNVAPETETDLAKRTLYQKLKGMECVLERGFLWRKREFEHRPELLELQKRIPSLRLDETIIRQLNYDEQLMETITSIKPETLTLSLSVTPQAFVLPDPESPVFTANDFYEAEVRHYSNPTKVTWEITLTRILEQGLRYKKTINRILDAFEGISSKLRAVCRSNLTI